ncbi:2-amino-3-ketobutyrate coenzyme A ligase, mitochondrial [Smittium mucronatum]|uniref:5-aminolevulinate synthase, mitochondrial n=1 Tax=Smittium mucronatum TaxID=133383 RepID=A0A1R0GZ79_9FUNG|nr:2-amino-3-ketobutyrate coenzyme A ligase, mitochondrial [Smittium mucronatum]
MMKSAASSARIPSAYAKRIISELGNMKDAGTFKNERVISSSQEAVITVKTTVDSQTVEKQVLNFCANNYLGLANDPKIIAKAHEYLDKYGNGLSSVRFICGTQTIHKNLEDKLSSFYGKEDTILYSSCFDANASIFEALLTDKDAVISDSLNHASIIDGIRLSKAKRFRYKNCDLADLEAQLVLADQAGAQVKMIVTDGVFSMDGKIAPLVGICDLADKYDAMVFVDDCHATGVIGKSGKGSGEYYGVMDRIHLINSTLGKSLGGASGGYTTGDKLSIAMLRNRGRPYLFSNTLAPSVVGGGEAALDLLLSGSGDGLKRLQDNTTKFRTEMKKAGFVLKGDDHPIVPIMLGDAKLASQFADEMLNLGIYVIGFSYPVVPKESMWPKKSHSFNLDPPTSSIPSCSTNSTTPTNSPSNKHSLAPSTSSNSKKPAVSKLKRFNSLNSSSNSLPPFCSILPSKTPPLNQSDHFSIDFFKKPQLSSFSSKKSYKVLKKKLFFDDKSDDFDDPFLNAQPPFNSQISEATDLIRNAIENGKPDVDLR